MSLTEAKRPDRFRINKPLPGGPPRSLMPNPVKPTRRSRVTNGKQLYVELRDKNSLVSRRLFDLITIHTADLGGADACSEAEKALIRRAAMLTLQLELLEQRWARNGGEASEKSLNSYAKATGGLRRVLQTLMPDLKRRPRDVTPNLRSYLRSKESSG
jgi:hypothetical protein